MNNLIGERYSRHIILDEIGIEGQKKLINSKILIIGLGGLGSGVATFLTRMGIGHIGIIDVDKVDISNLQRQILYDEDDIGISKIKTGAKKLKRINHNIIIDEYEFLLDKKNASDLIKKYDIVVDCTDNLYTRGIINRACIDNKVKCVFGAVSEFNGFIFTYDVNCSCFECMMGNHEKFENNKSNNKPLGVIGAMVGIIASMQALEVAKIILNMDSLAINKMILVDGHDFSISTVPINKRHDCYCNRSNV